MDGLLVRVAEALGIAPKLAALVDESTIVDEAARVRFERDEARAEIERLRAGLQAIADGWDAQRRENPAIRDGWVTIALADPPPWRHPDLMPGRGTTRQGIRIPDELWEQFGQACEQVGTDRAAVVRSLIRWWMGQPGAKVPERPAPPVDHIP